MRALFRVDAGPDAGVGHLQRSLSLAAALRERGVASHMAVRGPSQCLEWLAADGVPGEVLAASAEDWDERRDAQATSAAARRQGCELVIVDGYSVRTAALEQLRAAGGLLAVIDDACAWALPCDVVINGSTHGRRLPYGRMAPGALQLVGPAYALLRPEFLAPAPARTHGAVRNILLTLGGADPHGLMPQLIAAIDRSAYGAPLTVIVGPFMDRAAIGRAARACRRPVELADAPRAVRALMAGADLAVSAAGQTLYELACVGTPTITVRVADNQDGQLAGFIEAGAVHPAARAGDADAPERVRSAVEALAAAPSERARLGAAGQRLIDGRGTARAADGLLAAFASHAGRT